MMKFVYDFIEITFKQQVQRIANDYEKRSGSLTSPDQIKYIIEEPNSLQLKELLK